MQSRHIGAGAKNKELLLSSTFQPTMEMNQILAVIAPVHVYSVILK